MQKKHSGYSDKNCKKLFLLCWIAYFSTYICRLNFSAVMPKLLEDDVFPQGKIAAVSSAFFMCYGIGQIISGNLGDKLSSRHMIFAGIGISGVSNILIFLLYSHYSAILILWALNGAVQSMVWTPILRMAGDYFSERDKEKFGVDIATTVPIGTLASYAVSLLTLLFAPWRYVFLTCGVIVLIFAFIWFTGTDRLLPNMAKVKQTETKGNAPALPMKPLFKLLCAGFVIMMFIPIAIQGTLKDSVTQWIPTFLDNQYGIGASLSLALTMVLPIINVTGAYFAKAVNKKMKNDLYTSAIFFALAAVLLVILMLFGTKNIVISLVCMAGVTNCMFAVNVMLITMVPLRFSKFGRTSTVGGLLNAVAYIGCGLLNMGAGKLLEKTGSSWSMLFIMWLGLAFTAIATAVICGVKWKKCIGKGGELSHD